MHEVYLNTLNVEKGPGQSVATVSAEEAKDLNVIAMGDTTLEKTMLMFPQERKYVLSWL